MRNIDTTKVVSADELKDLISEQLKYDLQPPASFDVGIDFGNRVVSIRTQADLMELWLYVCQGKNCVLWCGGLKDKTLGTGKSVAGNKCSSTSCSGRNKVDIGIKKSKKAGTQDERKIK